MKENFTKGPWRSNKWNIIGSDNAIVAKVLPWDSSGCRDEDRANVALIKAAPDLYEALSGIVACMRTEITIGHNVDRFYYNRALEALEKAKGTNRHIAMVSCYKAVESDDDENLANAHLIMTAPKMYELLMKIKDNLFYKLSFDETSGMGALAEGYGAEIYSLLMEARGE